MELKNAGNVLDSEQENVRLCWNENRTVKMNSLNTGVIKSVEMDFGFMLEGFYSGELVHLHQDPAGKYSKNQILHTGFTCSLATICRFFIQVVLGKIIGHYSPKPALLH